MNGLLDENELKLIVDAVTEVLRAGYGKVEITVKDWAVLDVVPSPRRRVKSEGRTQDKKGRSDELDR